MNKKFFIFVALLFFITYAHAIAIIAPVVYVATISIIAFISNILISVAAYSAAKGFFGRKSFGTKFSSKLNLTLEIIGKAILLIITTTIAVFLLNPLTLQEAIISGAVAAIISLTILLLSSYKKIALISKEEKRRAFIEIGLFCTFIFFSCAIISFISIEIQNVDPNSSLEKQSAFQIELPSFDITSNKASSIIQEGKARTDSSKGISAPSQTATISDSTKEPLSGQNQAQKEEIQKQVQNLIFYPTSQEKCIISSETKTLSFTPANNCLIISNGSRARIYCPIIVSSKEFGTDTSIAGSGSCTQTYILLK